MSGPTEIAAVLAEYPILLSAVDARHGLVLAAALFAVGLLGVLVRRNLLFVLLSLEIMLNAAGVAFVAAGAMWGQPDGQVMFLFILATAAAETAVGLTLLLAIFRETRGLNSDAIAGREKNTEQSPIFRDG